MLGRAEEELKYFYVPSLPTARIRTDPCARECSGCAKNPEVLPASLDFGKVHDLVPHEAELQNSGDIEKLPCGTDAILRKHSGFHVARCNSPEP
jgi:hypothetical protein